MKILVCISKTPDTTAKIAFTQNNTKFASEGVQWIINPYDEWYALVRAIELKEKDPSAVLHLVTVGTADTEPIIRKALAIGGDEAVRVNADSQDPFYIATQIAEVARPPGDIIKLDAVNHRLEIIDACIVFEAPALPHLGNGNNLPPFSFRKLHWFMIWHNILLN